MRGEYRFCNGVVLHNSFTDVGLVGTLEAAFRDVYPASGLFVGLCQVVPNRSIGLADLVEPSIGVNGYARIAIARSAVGWPVVGTQGGDPFVESEDKTFTAVGGPFDKPITRMFLTPEATAVIGDVWALSASLNAELTIDPATPLVDRQFNYRVYGV